MYIDLIPAQLYKYHYNYDPVINVGAFNHWRKGEYIGGMSKIQPEGILMIVNHTRYDVAFLPLGINYVLGTTIGFFLRNFSLERIK